MSFIATARGQVGVTSDLYQTLKANDALLFSGFNNHDVGPFEKLLSDHLEFYHDKDGIITSKADFIAGAQSGLFKLKYKARRELVEGSLQVYPLKTSQGVLYGAIQMGQHRFYADEPGKPEYFTSRARFIHVWTLEDGNWKLLRGYSYDHQTTDLPPSGPNFNDDESVRAWLAKNKVPALGIGVITDGQLQQVHVYGQLKEGATAPFNAVFDVASLTKTVTTMVTLNLVSSGKWDLDEPICHYWTDPDVKDDPRSRTLTTRHILTHQTGFPNWRASNASKKLSFQFDPGTKYQYSGEGYEYLRHALEAKFHQTLPELAKELFFKPLNLNDTRFVWDGSAESRFAIPHDAKEAVLAIDKNTEANAADGLETTVADYGQFIAATMNGTGLSQAVFDQMVSHQVQLKENKFMGLGWTVYSNLGDGEYALSHSGHDHGVSAITFLLPKSKQGLIIMTNSDVGQNLYPEIVKAFLKDKGQAIMDIEMKKQ